MMLQHMSCVLLVWGSLSLSALGAHLDVDEAPHDPAAVAPLDNYPYTHWGPPLQDIDDYDLNTLDQMPSGSERLKRGGNGPSLSIINPLDVLRQRLLLEMARRQMRESQKQVAENRKLMKTIGKRAGLFRTYLP